MIFQSLQVALLTITLPLSLGASSTTVLVTPNNPQGWRLVHDSGNDETTTGRYVLGPRIPPRGLGSANLTLGGSSDGLSLALYQGPFAGIQLADITRLEYSTYRDPDYPGEVHAIALQFNVDYDSTDGDDNFQGRLIYEPYYTDTVKGGEWQTWNTINDKLSPTTGNGNWWFTASPGNMVCPASLPCTWSKLLAMFPNARINAVSGGVILKAGEGWPENFDGNVDALAIGVSGNDTTFDFEPGLSPAGLIPEIPDGLLPEIKADCKKGGWKLFDFLTFKNQGACISFVVGEGKEIGEED